MPPPALPGAVANPLHRDRLRRRCVLTASPRESGDAPANPLIVGEFMMRFRATMRGRFGSAALSAAAMSTAIVFAGSMPRAQTAPPAQSQAREVRLQQGRPFHGD